METSLIWPLLVQIAQNLLLVGALITALKIQKIWSDARDTTNPSARAGFQEQLRRWFVQCGLFMVAWGAWVSFTLDSLWPLVITFLLADVWVIFLVKASRFGKSMPGAEPSPADGPRPPSGDAGLGSWQRNVARTSARSDNNKND